MPENGHTTLDVAELERRLLAVEPAVVLTKPRILRRIIKHDCKLPGLGLQVPHRKSFVIARDKALAIAGREDLQLPADRQLPETLILLARPSEEKLASRPPGVTLCIYWRLLFHAHIHMALERKWAETPLTTAELRRGIQCIGCVEFDEARSVLRQEHFLLPPYDGRVVYEEFAALYLELRHFALGLLPRYFPATRDWAGVDRMLAEEIDAQRILHATRLEGAPDPTTLGANETETEDEEGVPTPAAASAPLSPNEERARQFLRQADRAATLGNVVRSAIQRERAALIAVPESAPGIRADARTDLDKLAQRLQTALDLPHHEAEDWRRSLPPLLERAGQGRWTVEARLLYDLQKVCIEHERGIFSVDVVDWIVSLCKRPFKRPLPGLREVLTAKHLRKAAARLRSASLADEDRQALASLLKGAVHQAEERVRLDFEPLICEALAEVGLRPGNFAEEVAFEKLIAELVDRIIERGLLTIGDLRDAISRNQLKLSDLGSAKELVLGDRLIRANRKLAVSLDGSYRRGEIYMRWLQRFSSLAFGTPVGRWLTRYIALPFGGAFMLLFAVEEIVGIITGGHKGAAPATEALESELAETTPHIAEAAHEGLGLVNPYSVGIIGVFLLLLLHVPGFRRQVGEGLLILAKAFKAVVIDLPRYIVRQPWMQHFLNSWPILLLHHYVVKPGAAAVVVALICWIARRTLWTTSIWSGLAFATATVCLNTRLGREIGETATDWYVRGWQYLWLELIPGIIRLILESFKRGMEGIERLLYTVDEWLRFRTGDSQFSLIAKPVLGLVWFVITYLIRVILNLFVEPTFNPIKHFPTVTVAAKMITPMMLLNHHHMVEAIAPLTGFWLGNAVIVVVEGLLPGLAGFLVWEFKENWKLYAANRSPVLRPILIGHHGETMLRFLKPGFHSGTIPRLYAKMRHASRHAQKTGDWRAFRKFRGALHHVSETIHRFLEREFLVLIGQSRCWQAPDITVDLVRLGTNRVRIELGCADLADEEMVLVFEERSGWLLAGVARPGWSAKLNNEQRRVLVNGLIGLYKLAGVHLVHEQLRAVFSSKIAYDATDDGLVVWPSDTFAAQATYDLTLGPTLSPHITTGTFPGELPTVPISPIVFSKTPVTWEQWVATWEKDQGGKGHPKAIIHGVRILPGDDKGASG